MSTRKEREKAEQAEAKRLEKEQKKAALAAKRAARDAAKGESKADDDAATSVRSDDTAAEVRLRTAVTHDGWSEEEDLQLIEGLRARGVNREEGTSDADRWEAIAAYVDGRTAMECVKQYRVMLARVKRARENGVRVANGETLPDDVVKRGKSKQRKMLSVKQEQEEAARKKKEAREEAVQMRTGAPTATWIFTSLAFSFMVDAMS